MNHFEKNMKKILLTIIESNKFISMESLSQKVGLSKRSIQNYIYRLQFWLNQIGINKVEIIKKQGYGIKLLIDNEEKIKLVNHLKADTINVFDDRILRRLEMLKALIFSDDELTIQYFADQFYVSRTVILKDLEWISQWLAKYNLQLFKCQRRGIGIVGDEISRRNAIADFFDIYKGNENDLIKGFSSCSRISEEKYLKLTSIYPRLDIDPIFKIVEDAEKKFDFFLTNEFFFSLVTHLIISIARLSYGKNVDESFLPPNDEYGDLELKTSEYISLRLQSEYNLKVPECERIYICMHLMGYNALNSAKDSINNIPKKIELLAISLVDFVDNHLGTTFAADKILFFGIISHLKTSIYRLESNASLDFATNDDFYKNHKVLFNVISKASNLYEEICGVKANKEELISLILHFGLSQKRSITKKRVLLVYNSGIAAGIKLCELLRRICQDIDIVDICSKFQVTFKSENDYDLIISTLPLDNINKPVADLSQVSKNKYAKFLDEFLFSLL